MKKTLKILFIGFILNFLLISNVSGKIEFDKYKGEKIYLNDFDPLVDINITVEIQCIRALKQIDELSDPDFFIKVFINNIEFFIFKLVHFL